MPTKHIIVIGGSVAGLGACLAFRARGHRVTVLEADATPLPVSPEAAFESWNRRGAPQARQSHALLARLRNLIRDRAPDLHRELLAAGATELRFGDRFRTLFPDAQVEPGDDDIVFLACRRIVFEYVLRKHVLGLGDVEVRDGCEVTGLVPAAPAGSASPIPHVVGVRVRDADGSQSELRGDLVVDASGRRSALSRWLEELGAGDIEEERGPCGIFYTTRFYRLLDGVVPPDVDSGIIGVDLGYLKVGIFAADSRVFSVTAAGSPDDPLTRRVLHEPDFETAVAAVPRAAEWVAPEMSEPVSGVQGMAKLENVRRFFVRDGRPAALGVVAIGDALIHTNPLTGRGCSLGWVGAFALANLFDRHAADLASLAVEFDALAEREIVPWYRLQRSQDEDSIAVADAQRRGEDPYLLVREDGTNDPKAFMRGVLKEGLRPALGENPEVLRIFMRLLNLLDRPDNLMNNPMIMKAVLDAYGRRHERESVYEGPSRQQFADLLGDARA